MVAQEVDRLLEDSYHLPAIFANNLAQVLTRGLSWLSTAILMFPWSQGSKRCKLKDVEEILEQCKVSNS